MTQNKTKPLLIGLTGYAGSGKDTLADIMTRDYGFKRLSFADKLKDILADLYGVPRQIFDDRTLKNEPCRELGWKTPREAAQLIGTEGFRNLIRRDTWVDFVMRQVDQGLNSPDNPGGIVITDVRFPEEFNAVAEQGGFVIGVMRNDHENYIAPESEKHIADLQERSHIRVHNNKSICDFKFKVICALSCIETMKESAANGILNQVDRDGNEVNAKKRMGMGA